MVMLMNYLDKLLILRNKMGYKLFLDDVRLPTRVYPNDGDWVVVRSFDEFVNTITRRGLPHTISFDHDLSDEHYDPAIWRDGNPVPYDSYTEKTGLHCAQWLAERHYDLRGVDIRVHSANPVGAENIRKFILSWNKFLNDN